MIPRPGQGTMTRVFLVAVAVFLAACTSQAPNAAAPDLAVPFEPELEVPSPDGSLRIEVGVDAAGRPKYRVVRRHDDGEDETVIEDSTLGLELTVGGSEQVSLAAGGAISDIGDLALIIDEFNLPTGKARRSRIDANTQSISVDFGGSIALEVELWVSDEGAAFRYGLDGATQALTRVEWERTSFALPATNRTWLQPHDAPGPVTPAYERVRSGEATAGNPGISSFGWTFPSLFASTR